MLWGWTPIPVPWVTGCFEFHSFLPLGQVPPEPPSFLLLYTGQTHFHIQTKQKLAKSGEGKHIGEMQRQQREAGRAGVSSNLGAGSRALHRQVLASLLAAGASPVKWGYTGGEAAER